jgi:hypothetical protein
MGTHLARARSNVRCWWKPIYTLELADGYQVVLFVFLHECFHLLIKRARRNTRQKESMCDRFAARALVDSHGAVVLDEHGRSVARETWDFQDLDRFVAPARRRARAKLGAAHGRPARTPWMVGQQLLLFES